QAEDGIRDLTVTGVQTCALPILPGHGVWRARSPTGSSGDARSLRRVAQGHDSARSDPRLSRYATPHASAARRTTASGATEAAVRSEERRVGKEGRPRSPCSAARK